MLSSQLVQLLDQSGANPARAVVAATLDVADRGIGHVDEAGELVARDARRSARLE